MNDSVKCMYCTRVSYLHAVRVLQLIAAIASIHNVASCQSITSSEQTTIEVTGARPLAAAVARVQELLRIPISYEETAYENVADLTRTTPTSHPGLKPMTIARGGKLNVTFLVSGINPGADAYLAVQAVLAAHAAGKFPGSYKAIQKAGGVEVIPAQVLGGTGMMHDVTPVMSRPVTLPYAERFVLETLQLLVDSIARAAGVRLKVLNAPFDESRRVAFAATGQSARDELASLLVKVGGSPKSYQLLYEPDEGAYYFNVNLVPANTQEPTGLIPLPTRRVPAADNPFFIKKK